jgi:hypothetical protein
MLVLVVSRWGGMGVQVTTEELLVRNSLKKGFFVLDTFF